MDWKYLLRTADWSAPAFCIAPLCWTDSRCQSHWHHSIPCVFLQEQHRNGKGLWTQLTWSSTLWACTSQITPCQCWTFITGTGNYPHHWTGPVTCVPCALAHPKGSFMSVTVFISPDVYLPVGRKGQIATWSPRRPKRVDRPVSDSISWEVVHGSKISAERRHWTWYQKVKGNSLPIGSIVYLLTYLEPQHTWHFGKPAHPGPTDHTPLVQKSALCWQMLQEGLFPAKASFTC